MSAELPRSPGRSIEGTGLTQAGKVGWLAFWILCLLVAGLIFWRDYRHTGAGLSIAGNALWGRDFVNVFTSGSLVLQGRIEILYDVEAYRAFQSGLFDGALRHHNYSYPPVTLLYTWLFALLPYEAAWALWLAGTGALFVHAARPYLREVGLSGWIAILAPASIINIWAGHYGFLVGALWLWAWRLLPARPAAAGVLIGMMLVKPHLAVLAPVVLLWRRDWTAFAAAAATVAALIGLSGLLFGFGLWATYLGETALLQAAMVDDVGAFFMRMMPTLTPALAIVGVPVWTAAIVQALAAIAAVLVLLRYLPRDSGEAGLATATATFLVLPYGFAYDMTVAGLAGLILFRRSLAERSPWFALAAGFAALVPMAVLYLNAVPLPVAPLLIAFQLLAMLGLLGRRTP